MPQPPNFNKMMKQVQQMQADMAKAQEQLKDEVVEASAGGGMVTVKVSGDLEVQGDQDRSGSGRPRGRRAPPGHGARGHERGAPLRAGARQPQARRAHAAGSTSAASGCPAFSRPPMYAAPVDRLITELSKLPGIGQRTAQRLAFHLLRTSEQDALGLAEAIREVKERIGLCEVCFNLSRGTALPDLPGRAARPVSDLRRRGAGRRDPDRAHARVPGRLPRARRRALADRRHRPRGPQDHGARSRACARAR